MAQNHTPVDEGDTNDWEDFDSESDADDFLTISSQVLSEGSDEDIFAYYAGIATASSAGALPTPMALGPPTPVIERLQQFRKSTLPSARTSRSYVDPFIAVKESLWMMEDIDGLVERTLDRMGRAFAYNSVYFLKIVLELQVVYITMKPRPPAPTLLDLKLVLKIAEILSGRLTRKETDNISLSRELQLRTLVSCLTLLQHLGVEKLQGDAYMQLLRDISERDADNEEMYSAHMGASLKAGDNEYLTRYACDCIRGLPADVPPILENLNYLNEEATHFLFASGFINQLEFRLTPKILKSLFARIKASPSPWHADIKSLYEGTMAAISLGHQALYKKPTMGAQFAKELAEENGMSLMEKLEAQVRMVEEELKIKQEAFRTGKEAERPLPMTRDTQMFICGLLDLLNHLVGAFPTSRTIVECAKGITFYILQNSDIKSFRYKAFEIIISSTTGMGENEYYDTMRNLDLEVESMARSSTMPDTRTDQEKVRAIERVEQLKLEKRDAMDRYEKKSILATGAADSIQRRVEGFVVRKKSPESKGASQPRPPPDSGRSLDEVLAQARGCSNKSRYSSATSSAPTLSSRGHSTDSTCGSQTCHTPTQANTNTETWFESSDGSLSSPIETGTCKTGCSCTSPTDTSASGTYCSATCTMRSTVVDVSTPLSTVVEPPLSARLVIPQRIPEMDLRDAITPGAEDVVNVKMRQLSQLISSPGLIWDPAYREENDMDDEESSTATEKPRQDSITLPIQLFDGPASAIPPPIVVPPEASMPEVVPESLPDEYTRPPLAVVRRTSEQSMDLPFRMATNYSDSNQSSDSLGGVSCLSHMVSKETFHDAPELDPTQAQSPRSTYPEPSLTRNNSAALPLRRQTRTKRLSYQRRINKPLPPINVLERSKNSILADMAPEVISPQRPPPRTQSAMDVRNGNMTPLQFQGRNNSTLGFRTPQLDRQFTPMAPIEDSNIEYIPGMHQSPINYNEKPIETHHKFVTKDSCFATAISRDVRHAVFLSPHSFQVFAIPTLDQEPNLKPKFHYRLGEWEGIKKKVPWKYKQMAVSDRYVVTIADERLQVHDLAEDCRVIFMESIKGWNLTAVDISADKLVVALSKSLGNRNGAQEDIGRIRIYRMNSPTYSGHRYEYFSDRDIFLVDKDLIHPDGPQDSARILTLSSDGHFLTCATTHFGHYFAWDLSRGKTPRLIAKGQLKHYEGPEGEILTGVTLFPDAQNMLVTTYPINGSNHSEFGGSYTQSVRDNSQQLVRQVSPRVLSSTISPYGSAAAFLTKHGTIWTTPFEYVPVKGNDILTSYASNRSQNRLNGEHSSRIAFAPLGERLVGVDKKGKCVIFAYPERPDVTQSAPPAWVVKSELGGSVEMGGDEEGPVLTGYF